MTNSEETISEDGPNPGLRCAYPDYGLKMLNRTTRRYGGGLYPSVNVCMKLTMASSSVSERPRLPTRDLFIFSVVSGAGQQPVPSRGSPGAQRGSTSRVL